MILAFISGLIMCLVWRSLWREIMLIWSPRAMGNRYPMGVDQPAQIECKREQCVFNVNGSCKNISPAIKLQGVDDTFYCFSERSKIETDDEI